MLFTKEYDLSSLMISVSGIRGKIGKGFGLSEALSFSLAFATMMREGTVVLGRDARPSGPYLEHLLTGALLASGNSVLNLGIVPTPTTKAVVNLAKAKGGIMISASHNPIEWNAFKLISKKGFFFTAKENQILLDLVQSQNFHKEEVFPKGYVDSGEDYVDLHIQSVLNSVHRAKIQKRKFRTFVDPVAGAGCVVIPELLQRLGCKISLIHNIPDGNFPRPPEPTLKNLKNVVPKFLKSGAEIGFALDPDADRLVLFSPKRGVVSEEYTLPLVLWNVLSKSKAKAKVVVNLSTSFLNEHIAGKFGATVLRSKVGEANVVEEMQKSKAIFGGEGNGGIIDPSLPSYGRDSLSGIANILELMASTGKSLDQLLDELPNLFMEKQSFPLSSGTSLQELYDKFLTEFRPKLISEKDGLWMYLEEEWIHIRPSNTEPIFRVIVETKSKNSKQELLTRVRKCVAS